MGIAFAISIYISFATPIGGSFADVETLKNADVTDITPVLTTIKNIDNDKAVVADFTGKEYAVELPKDFHVKPGVPFVGDFSYRSFDSTYILQKVIRIDPAMTFPLIQGLGELGRNILFHVPMSFVAFIVFLIATIFSIMFLRTKNMRYDLEARAYSALGLLMTILSTITGSIWAKFSWGVFWNFREPRESSILVLLLIYIAYFLLRQLLEDSEEKVARISAVYNIFAFVTVPFLMFVLPRITESLHPGGGGSVAPVINLSGKSYLDPTLKIVMWANITLFLLLIIWIKDLFVRITHLEQKEL